jgi:hypothetical protein
MLLSSAEDQTGYQPDEFRSERGGDRRFYRDRARRGRSGAEGAVSRSKPRIRFFMGFSHKRKIGYWIAVSPSVRNLMNSHGANGSVPSDEPTSECTSSASREVLYMGIPYADCRYVKKTWYYRTGAGFRPFAMQGRVRERRPPQGGTAVAADHRIPLINNRRAL